MPEKSTKKIAPPKLDNREHHFATLRQISAVSWQARTKKRVNLLMAFLNPKNAKEFVELFDLAFGADKLPYLWVANSTTTKGHPRTLFQKRFGAARPGNVGLAGYTVEEEQRRISVLKAEPQPRRHK